MSSSVGCPPRFPIGCGCVSLGHLVTYSPPREEGRLRHKEISVKPTLAPQTVWSLASHISLCATTSAASPPPLLTRWPLRLSVNIHIDNPFTGFPQIQPAVRTTETHVLAKPWCRPHLDKVVCLSSNGTGFGSICMPEHEPRRCESCRAA